MILFALAVALPWFDRSLPVAQRIKSLMDEMTLEEKVGQMTMIDGRHDLEAQMKQLPGAILDLLAEDAAKAMDINRQSRLKTPLLMSIDAIHGHSFWSGATILPTQIALASTWDEELAWQFGNVTANEMKNTGVSWTFSPVLCIARDLRWGRVGETLGEDPFLLSRMGTAIVKGYQDNGVAATAKHYVGYGDTQGGRDASESDLTKRKLESFFMRPFEEAVKNGAMTVMASFQGVDGLPTTVNKWLLTDVLRNQWNFQGLVVTDWDNLGHLINEQKLAKDVKEAAIRAIMAGTDMFMTTPDFSKECIAAVNEGKLDVKYIDAAVERILKVKMDLGLFEDERYPDRDKVKAGIPENRAKALKMAEEALILLKNDGTLPVNAKSIKKIAVLGANADHAIAQNGDWSLGSGQDYVGEHPRNCTITVVDGIKARFEGAEVVYEKGAGIEPGEEADLDKAIAAASDADLIVVVVGDRAMYWGEGKSTGTLELMGTQKELLAALVKLGKKFVIDVVGSKTLIIPEGALSAASAVIHQFCPGMLGGQAFAEALCGDINPSGKLPISVPYHVGQLPLYYNQIRGQHGTRYADLTEKAKWAFGYGLSYTKFKYSNAKLDKKEYKKDEDIKLTLTVTNKGKHDGVDVVQVYICDVVASVTWAVQELKAFKRVAIKAGESQTVEITIPASECSLVNYQGERIVEPGTFQLRIGQSSDVILYKLEFTITA